MNLEVELIAGVIRGGPPPSHLPAPRLIKIFVAAERDEFFEERRQLLEVVGPELQSIYDDMGIEVLIVDMQYGTEDNPDKDPRLAELFLNDIKAAHRHSRGCFLLLLVGSEYSNGWVPTEFTTETFQALLAHCSSLIEYYERKGQIYILKASSEQTSQRDWKVLQETNLRELLRVAAECVLAEAPMNDEVKNILRSTAERQLDYGLSLDTTGSGIVSVNRKWTGDEAPVPVPKNIDFQTKISNSLPVENNIHLNVEYKGGKLESSAHKDHEQYLSQMCQNILDRLQILINSSIERDPEIKSRKKMVQEVYAECLAHLSLLREHLPMVEDSVPVQRIKNLMIAGKNQKHGPILIRGSKYSGKTSILSRIYESAADWLQKPTFRIVRLCTSTPRSAYSLELLRILCEHVGFLSGGNDGNLPRDASFDPLYLNNWFTQILRRLEEQPLNEQLIILIDDLHRLHPLECDIVAALSWLPLNLPPGVHIVATSALAPEVLKLTPLQKKTIRSSEAFVELPDIQGNIFDMTNVFNGLERLVGPKAANRLGSILCSTEYGLSESEILELIMPTNEESPLLLAAGHYTFATWAQVKGYLSSWLKIRVLSGRLLFSWRWQNREIARQRYLTTPDILRKTHSDVAHLFFCEDSEDVEPQPPSCPSFPNKETPFQSTPQANDNITYTLRHVEEAWLHFLHAGDVDKLKKLSVCAFDFLLAAVQMISVSYLRCVLEHARRYLLERDLELIYYAIRKSSDVLTRDPLQLGAQLICWLRPVAEDGEDLVSRMVMAAMAWCDGYTAPLLVPLNGWLQPPLPLQIRTLTCPQGVKLVEPAPSGQHVVVVPSQGDVQLWHVMSGHLVHTFKGHSNPISCIAITQKSQYLLTGSEDTSIIVWDMQQFTLHKRICEHIAPVLSLTLALNNSVIVSGGEDSRIIITKFSTGEVIMTIDHHRGPVTAIRVDNAGEILISGSIDGTVCLWSLENFTLLNSIPLPSPISKLDVSNDSVFLLAACDDDRLYLRSLATGTEIHTLRGHQGPIKSICLAKDCRRAIAGGVEGRVSVFDMHSGRLMRNLPANPTADITSVKVTEKDDFLITAGGGRVTYWSFRGEESIPRSSMMGKKRESLQKHTSPISCLDISRDGAMAITGGVDSLVNLWQLNNHELLSSLEGHIASVTCITFSASGLFAASGSEDKTVRVWGLTLGLVVATFKHQAPVTSVISMLDGRRVISSDRGGTIRVWAADSGTLIQSVCGPGRCFSVTSDMRYAICGVGDNHVRIVSLGTGPEEKYQISHSQDITCLVVTPDSQSIITGSKDMSLKVWQLAGGKLSQVLVGHTDHVTCVAVAVTDKNIVISGSRDANLIVWDINTGDDLHTLTGHLGYVTCVRLSGDGTLAISGSEDKSLIVWDTKKGTAINSIMIHVPVLGVEMSTDCSRLALHLLEHKCLPILCLHNTPAQYVKLPSYVAPRDLRPPGPKRPARRLLKKEVSLDTYTWQRKYGHLTSGVVVANIEEQFRRRFSVSASMEEISKAGLTDSQQSLGPEQAALAQSQHFDQLEAVWNKPPPPKPRSFGRILPKQSSLQTTRISDSDEEEDLPG